MSLRSLCLSLIAVALVAIPIYFFLKSHELKEIELPAVHQGEAATNPLYAARLTLKRLGQPAISSNLRETLHSLPPSDTVLLIDTDLSLINESRALDLIAWMQGGGRLLMRATEQNSTSRSTGNDLFSRLEIKAEAVVPEGPNLKEVVIENALLQLDQPWVITLKGEQPGYHLMQSNGGLTLALFRPIGSGGLILVPSLDIFNNDYLGQFDHAELLWKLLQWHKPRPGEVWIIHRSGQLPLWQLLWQNGQPAIIGITALLLFWLLRLMFRFGPIQPEPAPERRSLMEHISASGQCYWQQGQQAMLLKATQQALLKRLLLRHPTLKSASSDELLTHLSDISGTTQQRITRLFDTPEPLSEERFTDLVTQLEKLRRTL